MYAILHAAFGDSHLENIWLLITIGSWMILIYKYSIYYLYRVPVALVACSKPQSFRMFPMSKSSLRHLWNADAKQPSFPFHRTNTPPCVPPYRCILQSASQSWKTELERMSALVVPSMPRRNSLFCDSHLVWLEATPSRPTSHKLGFSLTTSMS